MEVKGLWTADVRKNGLPETNLLKAIDKISAKQNLKEKTDNIEFSATKVFSYSLPKMRYTCI